MYSLYDTKHTDKLKHGNYYIVEDGLGQYLLARYYATLDAFQPDGLPVVYGLDEGEYRLHFHTQEVAPHIDLSPVLTSFQPVTINPKQER